jgi:hypothetical protein
MAHEIIDQSSLIATNLEDGNLQIAIQRISTIMTQHAE